MISELEITTKGSRAGKRSLEIRESRNPKINPLNADLIAELNDAIPM
jgi:hypothetical protein